MRKPVFKVSDQNRHNPSCTAIQNAYMLEIVQKSVFEYYVEYIYTYTMYIYTWEKVREHLLCYAC